MERLTTRNSEGIVVLKQPFACERCGDLQWSLPDLGNGSPIDRLADYEDLEEQCIRDNTWGLRILLTKWKEIVKDIQELYAYRKFEKQGKLLKLPCAVGDTVYEVQRVRERIQPYDIVAIKISRMGERYYYWELKDGKGFYGNLKGFGDMRLGLDVFPTESAAEAALKEMSE